MLDRCSCKDYAENIEKISQAQVLAVMHGGREYDGPLFNYCPWCGKEFED